MNDFEKQVLTMLEGVNKRFDGIEGQLDDMQEEMKGMRNDINTVDKRTLEMHQNIIQLEVDQDRRIGALEDASIVTKETSAKIDRLQDSVDKLKFGDSVIRIADKLQVGQN